MHDRWLQQYITIASDSVAELKSRGLKDILGKSYVGVSN